MNDKHINLRVNCGRELEEVKFTIKTTTPLGKLFAKYCDRNNLNLNAVNFVYNGIKLNEDETP